jgi:DNA-directed RNA polymerase specialized sigma24 family protein
MSFDDFQKLSSEDLALFSDFITEYYRGSFDEGFVRLRAHVQRFFPASRYVNPDDLVDNTLTRVMTKVVQFVKQGEPLENLESFTRRVADNISLEYHRKKKPELEIDADDSGHLGLAALSDFKTLGEREMKGATDELKQHCAEVCLSKLSSRKRELLHAYYPSGSWPASDLAQHRLDLAIKEGGGTANDSPEEQQRHLNNLQSEISKLKLKIKKCAKKCLETNKSRSIRWTYLQEKFRRT